MKTLVIGDVHGKYDRLRALLVQEGIVDDQTGRRINRDVKVVHLGDLGHFGGASGSPTGDQMCWEVAEEWLDIVLWGNHDRAVVDASHVFTGYEHPQPIVRHTMQVMEAEGKLCWAYAAHGHLVTHAGLHSRFKYNDVPIDKTDPVAVAEWLNMRGEDNMDISIDQAAARHAVGRRRGGRSPHGGILWRDIEENLYSEFPQVFGHSADHKSHAVRYCWEKGLTRKLESVPDHVKEVSYCIDVGGKGDRPGDNCLAGIWLPSGDVVRVDL